MSFWRAFDKLNINKIGISLFIRSWLNVLPVHFIFCIFFFARVINNFNGALPDHLLPFF
jgi:hypothetical protein